MIIHLLVKKQVNLLMMKSEILFNNVQLELKQLFKNTILKFKIYQNNY